MVAFAHRQRLADALGQLGGSSQCVRRRLVGAEPALLRATLVVVAQDRRGRHGLLGSRSESLLSEAMAGGRGDEAPERYEIGATLRGVEYGGVSPRPAAAMAGVFAARRSALVRCRRRSRPLLVLLGSLPVSARICFRSARA